MCGRFVLISSPEAVRRLFGYAGQPNFPPRYNIAPTQPVPVVLSVRGVRAMSLMRWGLWPSWVKDPRKFTLLINARAETVVEKPAFRNAMKRRRCLIPADGYYEWRADGSVKHALFVHPVGGGPLAFAGLAETWTGPNGEEVDTAAIVTTEASADLAAVHHRMPAVIAPGDFERWLDCDTVDALAASSLLAPAPVGFFAWHEVSLAVNRAANDEPRLIAPIPAEEKAGEIAASVKPARAKAAKAAAKPSGKASPPDGQGTLF